MSKYKHLDEKDRDCAPVAPNKKDMEANGIFSNFETETLTKDGAFNEVSKETMEPVTIEPVVNFNLFPNPSYDFLNLELTNLNISKLLSVTVYNNIGKEVEVIFTGEIENSEMKIKWQSNADFMVEGLYHIVVRENNLVVASKAFVFKQ